MTAARDAFTPERLAPQLTLPILNRAEQAERAERADELGMQLVYAFNPPTTLRIRDCCAGLTFGSALAPTDGNDAASPL